MTVSQTTDDLIVTDASPLITLALGDQLHALTAPGLRVVIPDAVWVEATRFEGAPGASELIEWIARNDDQVSTRPTEIGQDQLQRLSDGRPIREWVRRRPWRFSRRRPSTTRRVTCS